MFSWLTRWLWRMEYPAMHVHPVEHSFVTRWPPGQEAYTVRVEKCGKCEWQREVGT